MDAGHLSYAIILHTIAAFVIVVIAIMPVRKMARIFGIVDEPGGRKAHVKAIPPVGGLIIFTIFMLYGSFAGLVDMQKFWALYIGLIVLLVTGAIDDQFHVNAKLKFIIHVLAACLIAFYGNVQAAYLGNLFGFGVVWTSVFSYPFTIIAIVLLVNAMNLLDGLDGLAGGVSFVIFSWFIIAALSSGWYEYAAILIVLNACIAGFLVYNMRNPLRRRASLFLGDAGSMCLGLTIAWFGVHLARSPVAPLEPIVLAWIIGFPIFDTCAQFYRRICDGNDPFSPDRGHFHHHFMDAGVPVHIAVPIIISLIALMGGVGYVGFMIGLPPVVLSIGWVILLFIHIIMSRHPERYVTLIKSLKNKLVKPQSTGCVDKG